MDRIERIAGRLRQVYDGDPWHGAPAVQVLAGVTAAEAAARPVPNAHSIWEILLHMTGWTEEVRRRLEGGRPELPAAGDWPPVPEPTEEGWRAARDRFGEAHDRLLAALERLPEERLEGKVGQERDLPLGTGVTLDYTLQGILQHHVYHTGQIALLKKALAQGPTDRTSVTQ
ncbi:MAG TPA: DinB family protein [Thermoanaerobaculia bacterium]|nr:DinB family protein [Thermoanaerobaculia bacterium]